MVPDKPKLPSSCAGLTRATIKQKFFKMMDCRIKSGNDDN